MRIHSRRSVVGLLLACLCGVAAQGWAHAQELQQASYTGTLGPQRIGLILRMDGKQVAPSRYYYFRHLVDIPLTGELRAGTFTLHEQDATMTLHFVGNDSEEGEALDFDNSIGLEGQWTNGKVTLPVRLQGGGLFSAPPAGHWYQSITDEADEVFEARTKGFCAAVAKGDSAQAARYVHFPLRVNHGPGQHEQITDARQLAAEWSRIFTPAYVAGIADASPHSMDIVQGSAMLGNGLVFFSDKGADVLNLP
ncbi:hypothetical protein [Dyella telluris]|uniref:Uncharacterized protein n=1 Tax=Dyella telluris TaxID=2763498 RepID=A0A7G8Q1Y0_9GAMM|nr:hypothetical protein [Dyella telluris]QNK00788.1 hypothetical protein H8F01_17125 [Dyella telluris]